MRQLCRTLMIPTTRVDVWRRSTVRLGFCTVPYLAIAWWWSLYRDERQPLRGKDCLGKPTSETISGSIPQAKENSFDWTLLVGPADAGARNLSHFAFR